MHPAKTRTEHIRLELEANSFPELKIQRFSLTLSMYNSKHNVKHLHKRARSIYNRSFATFQSKINILKVLIHQLVERILESSLFYCIFERIVLEVRKDP